jgi:ABC-2 type transport system ATP-binding protein
LISEVALTADHVVVLGRGRVLADSPTEAIAGTVSQARVRVRSSLAGRLADLLRHAGISYDLRGDTLLVEGVSPGRVGDIAALHAIPLAELVAERGSLEDAYRALTKDLLDYRPGMS